jgi:ABC-type transport system involved in cytochrome c biogenesis permease subunit
MEGKTMLETWKKYVVGFILLLFLTSQTLNAQEVEEAVVNTNEKIDLANFESLVIQDGARYKPLDSFARLLLLSVHKKSTLKYKDSGSKEKVVMPAIDWFAELLFDPKKAVERPLFKIQFEGLVYSLGMEPRDGNCFSFQELDSALDREERERIRALSLKNEKTLSDLDRATLKLARNVNTINGYVRCLECFERTVEIKDEKMAKILACSVGDKLSFYELHKKRNEVMLMLEDLPALNEKVKIIQQKRREGVEDIEGLSDYDMTLAEILEVLNRMNTREYFYPNRDTNRFEPLFSLTINPVIDESTNNAWTSPWSGLDDWSDKPAGSTVVKDLWMQMMFHYRNVDVPAFEKAVARCKEVQGKRDKIAVELMYNKKDFYYWSLVWYVAAFFASMFAFIFLPGPLRIAGIVFMAIGIVQHGAGIWFRYVIMERPPVSTLYESIIFVALIVALCGFVIECFQRNNIWLLGAALAGSILHFVGMKYSISDGDTMIELEAVLVSNFWLATHVLCITTGYGFCFVVGIMAHLYLGLKVLGNEETVDLKKMYKAMIWVSLVALFFTTLGTILGGIWADQSWGRFWGWDPKENGAMLIVLWLLLLTHGRITGIFKDVGYAVMLILLNVVVAAAWYGVNLLNVGLHSYGFTDSIGTNLAIFTGIEVFLALALGLGAHNVNASRSE